MRRASLPTWGQTVLYPTGFIRRAIAATSGPPPVRREHRDRPNQLRVAEPASWRSAEHFVRRLRPILFRDDRPGCLACPQYCSGRRGGQQSVNAGCQESVGGGMGLVRGSEQAAFGGSALIVTCEMLAANPPVTRSVSEEGGGFPRSRFGLRPQGSDQGRRVHASKAEEVMNRKRP
jgi:hypothetical protein